MSGSTSSYASSMQQPRHSQHSQRHSARIRSHRVLWVRNHHPHHGEICCCSSWVAQGSSSSGLRPCRWRKSILDLCFCRVMPGADEPCDAPERQYMADHVPSLSYGCIPGFSAVGVITELGSGVLSHQIGQHVVYCNFPIKWDESVNNVVAGSDSGIDTNEACIPNRNADRIRDHAEVCCQNHIVTGYATLAANDTGMGNINEGFDSKDETRPNTVNSTFASNTCQTKEHFNHAGHSTRCSNHVRVDAATSNAHVEYKLCMNQVGSDVGDDGTFSLEDVVDRFCWMPLSEAPIGAQCEARIVPAHRLITIPSGIPDEMAVTALFPSLISLSLVKEGIRQIHELSKKQNLQQSTDIIKVLVYPAVHVLGPLLCQMALHFGAAIVIAAIPEGSGSMEECDAHQIMFSDTMDFSRNVISLLGDKVSLVYDLNGKGVVQSCLDCLKPEGLYISLEKFSSIEDHCSQINNEELKEGKMLVKMHYANYVRNERELIENASKIMAMLKANQLKCPLVKEYPFECVTQAHKDVHSQARVYGGLGVCLLRPPLLDLHNIPDLS